ncbi:uncharacterized protein K02A2.6-like [Leptopilina boulardi]|nr:uncharacterized protein K02A2.6-like [Leptopilina boulardi]
MYLLTIDAYSRWPEVMEMSRIDSKSTISKLREIFARFGIPKVIFSDNGKQFTSEEFQTFCKINGIIHRTSAPYHPSTNGLAENAVGSFKRGISKAIFEKDVSAMDLHTCISRYLFYYRNAPHCSTGESPAKRFLGRELRNRLDLLRARKTESSSEKQVQFFKGHRDVSFSEGEKVLIRNYKNPLKPTWSPAVIQRVLGERTYICNPDPSDPDFKVKRHTDQIISSGTRESRKSILQVPVETQRDSAEISSDSLLEPLPSEIVSSSENKDFNSLNGKTASDGLLTSNEKQKLYSPVSVNERRSVNFKNKVSSPLINSRPKRFIKPVNRLNL